MRQDDRMSVVLSRAEYFAMWSQLHGGIQPRGVVRGWLSLAHFLARPFFRLSPNAISSFSVVVAVAVAVHVRDGNHLLALDALLVVAIGMLDSLDGVVAVCTDRVTRWGAVLDSIADRTVDFLLVVMLVRVGASIPLAAIALTASFVLEYMRARAQGLGVTEVTVITAGEKPTRIIIVAMFLLACGVIPDHWQLLSEIAICVWLTVSAIGVVQLMRDYKKVLSSPDVRGHNLG